jgi:hypothetical protein
MLYVFSTEKNVENGSLKILEKIFLYIAVYLATFDISEKFSNK